MAQGASTTAIGQDAQAGIWLGAVATATAIGPASRATAADSTALGQGSVADQANTVSVGAAAAGGQRRIVNVAAGMLAAGSTDAVTGGQMFTANQRVAAAFGTTLDGSGQMNAPSYSIGGISYDNVASAFAALDTIVAGLTPGSVHVDVNSSGPPAHATGTDAIAIGPEAQATADGAVAIGSVAVGAGALASNGGAAFGDNTVATGAGSTAVGPGATATHANSAAFGAGATTTRANQQVYGNASHTHTMQGIASAQSRAAQTGPAQIVTSDSGGNLATATPGQLGLATSSDIAAINTQIAGLDARLDQVAGRTNRAITGVAMAFAMAGVPTLMPHERVAATFNMGTYQGAQGFAINAAWRIADNVQFNGGIGYGPDQRIVGGRAGLRVAW